MPYWKGKKRQFSRKEHPVRCFTCKKHIWSTEAVVRNKKGGGYMFFCANCYSPVKKYTRQEEDRD